MRNALAAELRSALRDPRQVARKLGLKVHQRGGNYVLVVCPMHGEKNASCSLHVRGSTLAVKCHGCQWSGDVLTLIAAVHGLDTRRQFSEVLELAAGLAGRPDIAAEVRGKAQPTTTAQRRQAPPPAPEEPARTYPPAGEIAELWATAGAVLDDPDASRHLVGRRIDPEAVTAADLARVLDRRTTTDRLPQWARYRGVWWRDTGHRLLVPAWDARGAMRSIRAWRLTEGNTPKRLPPVGHKASELVLANALGQAMLQGLTSVKRVVCVEGEPDFLARAITNPGDAVLGVLSGSWTPRFAARIPFGVEVIVRTHADDAGDRYAEAIIDSLRGRANVWRMQRPEVA